MNTTNIINGYITPVESDSDIEGDNEGNIVSYN